MKKFLAGSAIASIYTTNDELIAISNTQINDTINLSVESQEVRSGQGNALDYIYYHSSRMEGSLEDAQFNLDYIKHNIGAKENNSAQVYKSASHKIKAGSNTFPALGLIGDKVWIYYNDRAYTFDASYNGGFITFQNTSALSEVNVCIKYLADESGMHVRNLTIDSNIIPNVVKIVLEAQLFASESGAADSSKVGIVQFVIPKAQLSGTQEIALSASGVASTPLSYLALKADDTIANACSSATGVYGYITEMLDEGIKPWYDGVKQLAIEAVDDGVSLVTGDTINVYAVTNNSAFLVKPTNRLTYGYKTSGSGITWVTSDADAHISLYGEIKDISDVTAIYVKVVDSTGADITSIAGDMANII